MRPRTTEQYPQYRERFLREYAHFSHERQEQLLADLWRLGPSGGRDRREESFDATIDTCCKVSHIPEVEAVITLLDPIVQGVWDDSLDRVTEDVAQAQRDELGPEWILFLVNTMWKALASAPRPYHVAAMRTAAARLGALERAETAAQDLLLRIRGKFQMHAAEVANILARKLPQPLIRRALEELFGEPRRWIVPVVDSWAYRWKWAGEALILRRSSRVEVFRYWNPRDESTTPFCQWLVSSGRTVTVRKILSQVSGIERAIVDNDVVQADLAWPLIDLRGYDKPEQFNQLYSRHELGAPPFHWRCRTRLMPT
jgi:hypothetical protein